MSTNLSKYKKIFLLTISLESLNESPSITMAWGKEEGVEVMNHFLEHCEAAQEKMNPFLILFVKETVVAAVHIYFSGVFKDLLQFLENSFYKIPHNDSVYNTIIQINSKDLLRYTLSIFNRII